MNRHDYHDSEHQGRPWRQALRDLLSTAPPITKEEERGITRLLLALAIFAIIGACVIAAVVTL